MSLRVVRPGVLSLLQDGGRRGVHRLGLATAGALDHEAYLYCNRLLQNPAHSTAIEITAGGLHLQAQVDTFICLTGAAMPLSINDAACDGWTVHRVCAGDSIHVDYAVSGARAYLGVADGFAVTPVFGSTATVVREGLGGLTGAALAAGDALPCPAITRRRRLQLSVAERPRYQRQLTVRVVPGYQQKHFSRIEQRRFFGAPFEVSPHSDRMGYRLIGPPVACDITAIPSEGICAGAIQIPPDGQPIVLLADRQTIGGYPKIGAALGLDTARMAQLTAGCVVHFAPITPATARRALQLAQRFTYQRLLQEIPA